MYILTGDDIERNFDSHVLNLTKIFSGFECNRLLKENTLIFNLVKITKN